VIVRPWNWQAKEAFTAHFLTDAFSAGHVRTPRGEIQRHFESLYPNFRNDLVRSIACYMASYINDRDSIGWVATVDQLTDAIAVEIRAKGGAMLASFSIGDLISKVMHDADNAGLDVVSQQGPPGAGSGPVRWRAVGDDFLFPPASNAAATRTQQMAREAARLSHEEGQRAYSAGLHGGGSLRSMVDPANFRALQLIPTVDPASTANPAYGWRVSSISALPANILALIAAAFSPGHEVRSGLDSMSTTVPIVTQKYGLDLHTRDAFNCFKSLLLANPISVITQISAGRTCPVGQNNPCP